MSQRLADRSDLYALGIAADVLSQSPRTSSSATQDAHLDSASELVIGSLSDRYNQPFVSWGHDVKSAVCKIAAYELQCIRGFNPAAGADVNLLARRDQAMAWIASVAREEVGCSVVGAADSENVFDAPAIHGYPQQGWQKRAGRVF